MPNIDPSFFMIGAEAQGDLFTRTSASNRQLIENSYLAYANQGGQIGVPQQINIPQYRQDIQNLTPTPEQSEHLDESPWSEDDPDDPDEDILDAITKMFEEQKTSQPNAMSFGFDNLFGDLFAGDLFGDLFSGDIFGDLFGGDLFGNLFSGDIFGDLFGGDLFGSFFQQSVPTGNLGKYDPSYATPQGQAAGWDQWMAGLAQGQHLGMQ